jgi:disulfide bond formation protein DsbB
VNTLFADTRRVFALIAALALAAVAFALVTQHALDMQPCPWCVLQRLIFLAIAAVALLGVVWRTRAGRMSAAIGVDLLSACGIAAALWQHFVAAASDSCNLTLADKIVSGSGLDRIAPDVFVARASCADAATTLLGVPYEFWSLALFVLLGSAAILAGFRAEPVRRIG